MREFVNGLVALSFFSVVLAHSESIAGSEISTAFAAESELTDLAFLAAVSSDSAMQRDQRKRHRGRAHARLGDADSDSDSHRGRGSRRGHRGGGADSDSDSDSDSDDPNRAPRAKLRVKNLTKSRDALNWIRLDARESRDKDGRITSTEFRVHVLGSLRRIDSPAASKTAIAHVLLTPGRYLVEVFVRDDEGAIGRRDRVLTIKGTSDPRFDSRGVRWGLGKRWRVGDPSHLLRVASGPMDLGEVGALFDPSPDAVKPTALKLQSAASGGCGSTMNKTADGLDVAGGVLSVALAPFGLSAVGSAVGTAGTVVGVMGGNSASSCTQDEIENLAEAVEFQAKQIQQIENQLELVDAALCEEAEAVLQDNITAALKNYSQKFYDVSPQGNASCETATSTGPAAGCSLLDGAAFGQFMEDAGYWQSPEGPPASSICNFSSIDASGNPCTADSVQSRDNWNALIVFVQSNAGNFEVGLETLTGTSLADSADLCVSDCYKEVAYADESSLLIQTLETLLKNVFSQDESLVALAVSGECGTGAANNIVPIIDWYNQALMGNFQYAATILNQSLQMQWIINQFNYFGALPGGVISEYGAGELTENSIAPLGAMDATYYGGPTSYACSSTAIVDAGEPCEPSSSENGYQCSSGPFAEAGCNPEDVTACSNDQSLCIYAFCGGNATACETAPSEAEVYNEAQRELGLEYGARMNKLYELMLSYVVTDLPVAGQAWPQLQQGVCVQTRAPNTTPGVAPTSCNVDSDCLAPALCWQPTVPWETTVGSAANVTPWDDTVRNPAYIGTPIGWVYNQYPNLNVPSYAADASFQAGSQCASDYGSATVDPVCCGQPGTTDDTDVVCPQDFPYCIGYDFDVAFGQCSNGKPWTDQGFLYQYALNDPFVCGQSLKAASDNSSAGAPPTLGDAWARPADCPAIFSLPGGGAPRYGYFDGKSLQPYSFEIASAAAVANGDCPAACQSPSCNSGTPSALTPADPIACAADVTWGTCSAGLGLAELSPGSSACTGFCTTIAEGGESYCVDSTYALRVADASNYVDCQMCGEGASEPVLTLAGLMLGNVNACDATSPKLDWFFPEAASTVNGSGGSAANLAMLCDGCAYLSCGNAAAFDSGVIGDFDFATTDDSWPATYASTGSCPGGAACTVAGNCVGNGNSPKSPGCRGIYGWENFESCTKINFLDWSLTSSISDYRCGYVEGSGVSYVGVTNAAASGCESDGDQVGLGLNGDAQNGDYPWGCGVFGFNTISEAGSDGSTGYSWIVFEQPNAMTGLWDPLRPDGVTQNEISSSGFSVSGRQMGFALVSQCQTSCPNQAETGLDASEYTVMSIATPATKDTLDTLGYACELYSDPNAIIPGDIFGGTGPTGEQQTLRCTLNDGRQYAVKMPPSSGGTNSGTYVGTTDLVVDQTNKACPDACFSCNPGTGGFTPGGMALNDEGACTGFCSGDNNCGGYCYNQPTGNIPPIDCRGCGSDPALEPANGTASCFPYGNSSYGPGSYPWF